MSAITRNTIWFYAGAYPYIDLEIKGNFFAINFDKTLRFLRPTAPLSIYDGDAEADGMDLTVGKYTWFIVCDMGMETETEISCVWTKLFGYQVRYYAGRTSTQITFPVNPKEAKEIQTGVEMMILQAQKDAGEFKSEPVQIFTPSSYVLKYRVRPLTWTRKFNKDTERIPILSDHRAKLTAPSTKQKKRVWH